MLSFRRIAGPVAALGLFLSLGACSSAPEPSETSDKTASDLYINPVRACWISTPGGGCSVDSTPHTPAVFSFAWMLEAVYGCQPAKGYSSGWYSEGFTICPSTPALASYLANYKPGDTPNELIVGPHENPAVCNSCLWPAPTGWVYVFWSGYIEIPICSGLNCGSPL